MNYAENKALNCLSIKKFFTHVEQRCLLRLPQDLDICDRSFLIQQDCHCHARRLKWFLCDPSMPWRRRGEGPWNLSKTWRRKAWWLAWTFIICFRRRGLLGNWMMTVSALNSNRNNTTSCSRCSSSPFLLTSIRIILWARIFPGERTPHRMFLLSWWDPWGPAW